MLFEVLRMLDKSIKTPDRVAGNSVMKKVLLGTIVGCLVATLLAVGLSLIHI